MLMMFLAVLAAVVVMAALFGVNVVDLAVEVMALGMIAMKLVEHSAPFQILVLVAAALLLVLLSILHRSRPSRSRDVPEKRT